MLKFVRDKISFISGICLILLSFLLFYEASTLSPFGSVFPYAITTALLILSVILIFRSFKLEIGNSYNLIEGKHFFIHSLWSLLGSKFKFNKNLRSCTYFSCLHKLDINTCVIGYGINDVNWRLKKVRIHKIWR